MQPEVIRAILGLLIPDLMLAKLVVQGAAVAAMGAALYFLNTLPGPTSGWAAK